MKRRAACALWTVALLIAWLAAGGAARAGAPADTTVHATVTGGSGADTLMQALRGAASPADTTAPGVITGGSGADTLMQALRTGASGADSTAQAADTVAAAAVDRFAPTNSTYIRSSENDVSVGNALKVAVDAGEGWTYLGSLMAETRRYRTQKMTDVIANLANQATKTRPGIYVFNLNLGQNYSKKKTLGLGRFGKDIVYDNQTASAAYSLIAPRLRSTSSNLTLKTEGRRGTNDFKYDRSIGGSLSGSLIYAVADMLTASGGFGTSRRVESSEIGDSTFSGMPSYADTIRANLSYGRELGAKVLEVGYLRSSGVEHKVMPPLGNSLEILDDPSKAQLEEGRLSSELLTLRSTIQPFGFLLFNANFRHSLDSQEYLIDQRRSGKRENTSIDATLNYRYSQQGSARFVVSSSEAVSDLGAKSLSSFTEKDYSINMGVTQVLFDSLTITANGVGRLKQRFYKLREANPRDADYLHYNGEATIKSRLFKRVSVDIIGAAARYETINMDAGLSGDNRVDYQYRLGPTIRIKPLRWLSLAQDYIVKIEFTDFVFTEDKNYLNRTTTLNTRAEMRPGRSTSIMMRHSYLMKDTGSYLQRNGQEYYSPNNRNIEHSLSFDVRYEVTADFVIKAIADFRTQDNSVYGMRGGRRVIVRTTTYESGGVQVGFVRRKELWSYGSIDLDIAYARNYGAFITPAREEFWAVNSVVNLRF